MTSKPLKLTIVSGKGGVGKSMLCSAFCLLAQKEKKIVAVDCDADAPNLAIWLNETDNWHRTIPVMASSSVAIDYDKCANCGECVGRCHFGAITRKTAKPGINQLLCEGCGACELACPYGAIKLEAVESGEIKTKQTRYGFPLVLGRLFSGQAASGKIVTKVKEEADRFENDFQIIDSSPGTGSPVIAALQGTNFAVLVTEPTPSGLSDVNRVLEVVRRVKLPWALILNKWDINQPGAEAIEKWAGDKLLGKVSYDKGILKAVSRLVPVMEANLKVAGEIKFVYNELKKRLEEEIL